MSELNGYELSRQWFDFAFENPHKVNPNHTAMYFFAIEHCNRLGWKEIFGFPSTMVMEAMGVKSYNTYKKTFDEIVEWGFFKLVEKSKNQYSSNIIALSKNNKANNKALDKAFTKHASKQQQKQSESKESINKQINKGTIKPLNNEGVYDDYDFFRDEFETVWLEEFLPIKKKKKASLSETAMKRGLNKIQKLSNDNYDKALEILQKSVDSGWTDFYEPKTNKDNASTKGITLNGSTRNSIEHAEDLADRFKDAWQN